MNRNDTDPKPLPRRRRTLSTPTGEAQFKNMGMFNRLPYELRYMIYVAAIGNRVLQIIHVPSQKRIGHVDYHLTDPKPILTVRTKPYPLTGKTSLLKTCRQIYVEAARVLYTTNTLTGLYYAHHWTQYTQFLPTVRTERLASIMSLYIVSPAYITGPMSQSSAPNHWCSFCDVMATEMPGLRHLEILLDGADGANLPLNPEEQWVKALLVINGLQTFKLDIEPHFGVPTLRPEYRDRAQWLNRHLEEKLVTQG